MVSFRFIFFIVLKMEVYLPGEYIPSKEAEVMTVRHKKLGMTRTLSGF